MYSTIRKKLEKSIFTTLFNLISRKLIDTLQRKFVHFYKAKKVLASFPVRCL